MRVTTPVKSVVGNVDSYAGGMCFVLPYPPSANRYWRHDRGVIHLSDAAKNYRQVVAAAALSGGAIPLAGDVKVTMRVYRPAKRGDLDNSIKILLDALRGFAYADDRRIVSIEATRHDSPSFPRVIIDIQEARKREDHDARRA